MKIRNQYIIPFGGLKDGFHDFSFVATDEFFEEHSTLEARKGDLDIQIRMLKKNTFLIFEIFINGFINILCDRCLDYYDQDIIYKGNIYVKFSERNENSNETEEVIFLAPGEQQIDLEHYIYESISLSIPLKRIHPGTNSRSSCNELMIKELNRYAGKEKDNEINPAWDKLKDFFSNK